MFKFEQLDVWKLAVAYVDDLVLIAEELPSIYRYSLGSQLIRAAISILNNIAEATGRRHGAESANLFNVAKGSAYETVSMLIFMKTHQLMENDRYNELYATANQVAGMLSGLMKSWRSTSLSLSRFPVQTESSGFGLLEVLISASILALIAGATVGLASTAVNTAVLGANRTAAQQLAQQGVEMVRQMRDTTYIDGQPNRWNQQSGATTPPDIPASCTTPIAQPTGCGLVSPTGFGTTWSFDPTNTTEAIPVTAGVSTTTFDRSIQLKAISWYDCAHTTTSAAGTCVPNDPSQSASSTSTVAYQVVSNVSWVQNGRPITVQASTFLTDWRPVQ